MENRDTEVAPTLSETPDMGRAAAAGGVGADGLPAPAAGGVEFADEVGVAVVGERE